MNSDMKFSIIDIETTGLDAQKHEIIEIACLMVNSNLEIVDRYQSKVIPERPEDSDPTALLVNGYSEASWKRALPLKKVMADIAEMTQGTYLLAYNVSFDYAFLKAAFSKTGVQDGMKYQRLDLMTLAFFKIHDITSWSLKSVSEYLGIKPEPSVHQAMNGATCAYEVFKRLTKQP